MSIKISNISKVINMYRREDQIDINSSVTINESSCYDSGYVFTRLGKGKLNKVRSLRINLSKFALSSENRRILRKTENLIIERFDLPYAKYTWEIHKLGKDFYQRKFGDKVMSASKIKEMFTDQDKSNMNSVLVYKLGQDPVGYCLCYENSELIHYAYPFYNLDLNLPNLGISMMTKSILLAKDLGKQYIYLGSVMSSKAKYKLQFNGLEWYDLETDKWSEDIPRLKQLLTNKED